MLRACDLSSILAHYTWFFDDFPGLAQPITVDQVIGLFSPYGVVTYVRLLRDKVTKELTGSAMVEFKTEEGKAKYVP